MDNPADIEFVLFDIGGVLADVLPDRSEERWRSYGFTGSIMGAMYASGAKGRGDVGHLDPRGMASALSDHLGAEVSLEVLKDVWGAMVSWRPFVLELLGRVVVPYGVLSTIDPIHSEALGPLPGADPIVYSWDIGVTKPEAAAFVVALERAPVSAKSILYVDDRRENVEAADAVGLHATLVDDQATLEAALLALLKCP